MTKSTVLTKLKAGTLKLSPGSHVPNGEACVMEAVSQYAGETWSDHPQCADASISTYCRVLNDRSPQWVRDELAKRIPRLAKAKTLPTSVRFTLAEAARQSAIRTLGPKKGAALKALPPITDEKSAHAAANAAANAADAAAYAAYVAANAAANAAAAHAASAAAYAAANAADAAAANAADAFEWKEALATLDRMLDLAAPADGGKA